MTWTRAYIAIAAVLALGCGLAAGGAAWAQVSFQSAEVLGVSKADLEAGLTGAAPKRYADGKVRFWSDDRRTYQLEGFGCQFELVRWPGPASDAAAEPESVLEEDIALYRKAAGTAVAQDGTILPIQTGALYRVAATTAQPEAYGLDCSDRVSTAVALDVLRTQTGRQLRIFIVQVELDSLAPGQTPRKTMAVAFMQNVLFLRGDAETLARAAPVTKDLYEALAN